MFRKSVRVASRIAVSAAISWTLIPIAIDDAPAPTPSGTAAAPQAGAPSGKRLFTVPEDGMGDTHWLSGATRAVREIMLKRPNEDLVICVAGCIAKQDRVVYAQPSEPETIRTNNDLTSDGSPSVPAAPPAPAASAAPQPAEPVAKASEPAETPAAAKAEAPMPPAAEPPASQADAAPTQPDAAPANSEVTPPEASKAEAAPEPTATPDSDPAISPAAKAAAEDDAARMDFVPSMAPPTGEPTGDEPAQQPASEPAPESAPAADAVPETEGGETPPAPTPELSKS